MLTITKGNTRASSWLNCYVIDVSNNWSPELYQLSKKILRGLSITPAIFTVVSQYKKHLIPFFAQQQVKRFRVILTLLPNDPSWNLLLSMAENTRHRAQRMARWALTSCPVEQPCVKQWEISQNVDNSKYHKLLQKISAAANSIDNNMPESESDT